MDYYQKGCDWINEDNVYLLPVYSIKGVKCLHITCLIWSIIRWVSFLQVCMIYILKGVKEMRYMPRSDCYSEVANNQKLRPVESISTRQIAVAFWTKKYGWLYGFIESPKKYIVDKTRCKLSLIILNFECDHRKYGYILLRTSSCHKTSLSLSLSRLC